MNDVIDYMMYSHRVLYTFHRNPLPLWTYDILTPVSAPPFSFLFSLLLLHPHYPLYRYNSTICHRPVDDPPHTYIEFGVVAVLFGTALIMSLVLYKQLRPHPAILLEMQAETEARRKSAADDSAPPRKISQGDRRSQLLRMSSMKSPMLTSTKQQVTDIYVS